MQTLRSQKVAHPQELQTINTALGHGWRTGVTHYTFSKKYQASEFVYEAVEIEVSAVFHHE